MSHGKVTVFGAGSWGTAFSVVLADAGNDVTIWGRRQEVCDVINAEHRNPDYLPEDVLLPDRVRATHDVEEALYLCDRVAVMSARPGRTLATVAFPAPRVPARLEAITSPEFTAARERALEVLAEGRR